MLDALAIMLAIVVPAILCTLAFAWWYRATNRQAQYSPQWAYSGRLEILVWSIPALVILFLGGIAWIGSHDLDPAKPLSARAEPLEVQVVALDWKWLFIYPEQHVASINRAGRAGRNARPFSAHLRLRHERLFRAATRQRNLRHERHGHRTLLTGGPERQLSRTWPPTSTGTGLRT